MNDNNKIFEATANAVVSFCMKNFYDSYIFVIYHFFYNVSRFLTNFD